MEIEGRCGLRLPSHEQTNSRSLRHADSCREAVGASVERDNEHGLQPESRKLPHPRGGGRPLVSRCLLVDASTCQQIERALWPWVRPGARIVEGQLALHGLFNAHTARHLQMGRRAMVGVIDAAAEEGDLFLDFLRECE